MQRSVALIWSHVHRPLPQAEAKYWVGSWQSSVNLKAMTSAVRMMSSGATESMCVMSELAAEVMVWRLEGGGLVASGRRMRNLRENLASRESRMQTASAMVSSGRAARVMMVWTREMDGGVMMAPGGCRLTRWTAGPELGARLISKGTRM